MGGVSINQVLHINSISGACMVLKKELFDKVGKFDEKFFMFWEDTDFCNRVLDLDYLVAYDHRAEITHHKGGSRQLSNLNLNLIFYESLLYFFIKHKEKFFPWNYILFIPYLSINLIIYILKINYFINKKILFKKKLINV